MFLKIPFEKVIDFKTNISEITKMSLEHDYNVNDGVVLGNFYVSGEYRSHEVSVNTDEFKYTLPFEVTLTDDIRNDTLEFNIEDFTYEIVNDHSLKVDIVYSVKADSIEEERKVNFQSVDENELESELAYIDDFLENNKVDDIKELKEEEKEDVRQEELNVDSEKPILETMKDSDDTFVTYHIHIVKDNENIDTICNLYNVTNSVLSEYNNVDSFNVGDKVIIPKIDE